jgi:hypothetical protein
MLASENTVQVLVRYGWQATVAKFDMDPAILRQDSAGESNGGSAVSSSPSEGHSPELSSGLYGKQVVVQTPRGIELGTVLRDCQPDDKPMGRVLRAVRPEDELLNRHLQEFGQTAFRRCMDWLQSSGHDAVLLEVEPLLDCKTLLFHFLSGVDPLLQGHVDHLVSLYESEVAASDFVRRVKDGCGPDCGTSEASGSGCGSSAGCSGCSIGCGAKRR